VDRGRFYAIRPVLPELHGDDDEPVASLPGEYSSGNEVMSYDEVVDLLIRHHLMFTGDSIDEGVEMLR
jgi:hypothetical protein